MGACIGKKNSKYRSRQQPQSDIIQSPQPKVQDDTSGNKSSPSSSKKLPVTDGLIVNNDDEWRISQLSENSINPEIQIIIDEQNMINEAFSQPFPSRIISVTDSELEYELAKLIFENSENQCVDLPLNATIIKINDT